MKTLFTFFVMAAGITAANAQQIVSMTITPANPDNTDNIEIIVETMFSSGGCAGTAYYSQSGNDVYASSLHCVGMAAYICTDYDTISLPPQPVGTYNVYYTLSSGAGPFPCSPGIVPDDSDTLTFTVVSNTSVPENENAILNVYPNPVQNQFVVEVNSQWVGNGQLHVLDEAGRLLITTSVTASRTTVNTQNLAHGVYFVQVVGNNGSGKPVKFVKE
jgi:hypothetical protein